MNPLPVDILLVEDNEDDILLIEEAFSDEKFMHLLCAVRDGEEAMAYLRNEGKYQRATKPGIILLDINMPKKNGFEVLDEIKKDSSINHIPVMMLSTSDRKEDITRSYAKGACSYIKKPASFDKFKSVVNQISHYWVFVSLIPN